MRALASVFISYRREDAAGHAGRLCDRLNQQFGGQRVFMDVEDIQPGQHFADAIGRTLDGCAALLVVMGPRWLDLLRQRASHPEDFVRLEVAAALARGIAVIPVLVGGAVMPSGDALPPELRELSRRQAVVLRDDRFDDDASRLTAALREAGLTPAASAGRFARRTVLGLGAAAALGAAGWWWGRGPAAPVVEGVWNAQLQREGQAAYRVRLTFVRSGDTLTGAVDYPTGSGTIEDGVLTGARLTFRTVHVPQFADEPAVIRYTAEVEGESMTLTVIDESGITRGTATRAAAAQPAP